MNGGVALALFAVIGIVLMSGFPVAFVLAGVSLLFALVGVLTGNFELAFLSAFPNRLYGIMTNETLLAVPLFVFMGVMLERARLADQLLSAMAALLRNVPAGLGLSVVLVGALMAASTGIVGATVVTMALLSLPTMLQHGYRGSVAAGTICAAGTLGQIIPPSIVLVLLADVMANAYQQAQISQGVFSPETVSVGELFLGALLPGLLLVMAYMLYLWLLAWHRPDSIPSRPTATGQADIDVPAPPRTGKLLILLLGPLGLIVLVLGSIMAGVATPTEAAAVGALGASLLAMIQGQFNVRTLREVVHQTAQVTAMVFMILIAAALFSLVFRGYGGDEAVVRLLTDLPGGTVAAVLVVMLALFLLGFVLDFIEIVFIVVPIVGPILLAMGLDPVWLGVMIALNLQTSFLTPPFGFALFYLRGTAPAALTTGMIYRGVVPFIVIQLLMLATVALWPALVTWLPEAVFHN